MSDIENRVITQLAGSLAKEYEYSVSRLAEARACGSPIETALILTLTFLLRIQGQQCRVFREEDAAKSDHRGVQLVPQYRFENYRIDFALLYSPHVLFVECDGHDFHERTKEQAAHDRLKDRQIQLAGIRVLRFTGSEIYRDSVSCAHQIIRSLNSLTDATKAPPEPPSSSIEPKRIGEFRAAQRWRRSKAAKPIVQCGPQ